MSGIITPLILKLSFR